ncbi:hypothetical protein TNCV_1124991 [Trichonephila clavipes]|uniref:RNase H type-1 domain-containing protein n=1 Tax=Trichonephila clavipes TaxID=2585209 RepID=A0A8X6SGE6_TRICX|nr:hypothetical protein TNCV_1124991 [Trichonephila clavipes]
MAVETIIIDPAAEFTSISRPYLNPELIALDKALGSLALLPNGKEIWILSDSRGAIQHLSNWQKPEEKNEMSTEIADNQSIQNYENNEIDIIKEDQIMYDISATSIHEDTGAFSNGTDKTRSLKKFSPFTIRSNISGPTKQTSAHYTETPLAKFSKYEFYDNNGEEFIIDSAEFEKEEKELIDLLNSNSEILPNNPFYEKGSYNENYHLFPISSDASPGYTDKDVKENNLPNNNKNAYLEILPNNPFL